MEPHSSESEVETQEQPLKHKGSCDKWSCKSKKRLRDSGEAYISRFTEKEVAARVVGPSCDCSAKCYEKVGEDNIKVIFTNYWALKSHDLQSHYIHNRVQVIDVKRGRVKGRESRRKASRVYTVLVNNVAVDVCKQAFLNIHGLSDKRVRNVLVKAAASSTGTLTPDQRGRHVPSHKVSEEAEQLVPFQLTKAALSSLDW